MVFPSNLDVWDCLYKRFRKVCLQCYTVTVVHAMDSVLLLGSLRTQCNVLSEEELLDKVNKVSKRASETREQTLHMLARTEPNT